MNEIFYVDLYFFINFSLDALCLFATSRILPRPITLWRLVLASAVGGAASVFFFFFSLPAPARIPLLFAALLGTATLAFPPRAATAIWRPTVFFVLSLMLCGGAFTSLQALAGVAVSSQRFTLISALTAALILAGIVFYFFLIQRRFHRRIQTLCLIIEGKYCYANALVDSGNLLTHPQSGLAVMLIGTEATSFFFSPELAKKLHTNSQDEMNSISINTPGGKSRLTGFVTDEVFLCEHGKKRRLPPVFLACDPNSRTFGGCDLIIPPSILPLHERRDHANHC